MMLKWPVSLLNAAHSLLRYFEIGGKWATEYENFTEYLTNNV
jgi:hypothetical protein